MQLGRAQVSEEERLRCTEQHLCYYCGNPGYRYRCPVRPSKTQVGNHEIQSSVSVPAMLSLTHDHFHVSALIDSGAAVNIIDNNLVGKHQLPTIPCTSPLRMMAVNNQPIDEGYLYRITKPLK
ncbi:hypothetical protein QTP70_003248 [Hemibagrus guttatus]|uniref:Uncharacterized protein n=1 Tax=Hemibagrus guttatus TaxID=175788 RepID=A0AAE0URK3_9TELE|nr:hypothetical protein QTP70_003248 [Hemibagrus guttatus]KAK3540767.1 hypothetical protein QTP86_001597 [Hemibagrus guttatus]